MCVLFGLSCNEEDRATKSLPKFANQFGTYSSGNNDGWGIAYFNKTKSNKGIVERASDGSEFEAAKSKKFFEVVDEALSTNIIAHVRNASPGTGVCGLNCHPFPYHYMEETGSLHITDILQMVLIDTPTQRVPLTRKQSSIR